MLPYGSLQVFSLIAWVTMNTPCPPLSLSMVSALVSHVRAWAFCLLQYLCSLRYFDILLPPLYATDIHRLEKSSAEPPAESHIQHKFSNHSTHKDNSLTVSFECSQFKVFLWYLEDQLDITGYCRKCHGSHHMRLRSRVFPDGMNAFRFPGHSACNGKVASGNAVHEPQLKDRLECPWVTRPQTWGHGPWGEISLY